MFIVLKIIFLSVLVFLCIVSTVVFIKWVEYLWISVTPYFNKFSGFIVAWWKNRYKEYDKDEDYKIIYITGMILLFLSLIIWLYPLSSESVQYGKDTITLQVQLITVCLATVAGIIAFKNYRRKSDNEIYFNCSIQQDNDLAYISKIILHNAKDKSIVIFAVDYEIKGKRIRLFQDTFKPIIISAYSSIIIPLEKTFKYTNDYVPERFSREDTVCICVTTQGSVEAKILDLPQLNSKFREKCIFPQTIRNIPENIRYCGISSSSTHWVKVTSHDEYKNKFITEYISGYFDNDIFYVHPKEQPYFDWLNGKSKSNIEACIMHLKTEQGVPEGIYGCEEIEFINVGKIDK